MGNNGVVFGRAGGAGFWRVVLVVFLRLGRMVWGRFSGSHSLEMRLCNGVVLGL